MFPKVSFLIAVAGKAPVIAVMIFIANHTAVWYYDIHESDQQEFGGGKKLIGEFAGAAFPWSLMDLFVTVSCSYMSKTENERFTYRAVTSFRVTAFSCPL